MYIRFSLFFFHFFFTRVQHMKIEKKITQNQKTKTKTVLRTSLTDYCRRDGV